MPHPPSPPPPAEEASGFAAWSVTYPGGPDGAPVRIGAAPVDVRRDAALIHHWMNRAHVARWWELDQSVDRIRSYLTGLTHLQPWLVSADGRPFGYVETYRVSADPLADVYPSRPSDVGWHLLIGPPDVIGNGLPRLLGHAFAGYLLGTAPEGTEPAASDRARSTVRSPHPHRGERLVCEPDVRNTRMHAFCRRLGFRDAGEVALPDKRALLMIRERETGVPTMEEEHR